MGLTHVGKNNDQEDRRFQDQYLIEFNDGEGYRCLFFGDKGKDIYPSLQNCHSFDIADKGSCPWANGGKGLDFCGFNKEGMDAKTAIFENGQAIWRIVPLKMNENKYLLMSASKGRKEQDGRGIWEDSATEDEREQVPSDVGVEGTQGAGRPWHLGVPRLREQWRGHQPVAVQLGQRRCILWCRQLGG